MILVFLLSLSNSVKTYASDDEVIYKNEIVAVNENKSNDLSGNQQTNQIALYATVSSKWFSQGVHKGSNNISRYTVSALIALIGYISGSAAGAVVAAIAEKAVSEHWIAVYYNKETFVYMKRCASWPSYPNWVQAGKYKYITKYYSNSSRKKCKGTTYIDE